ncbi:hypothetical protein GIB67_003672 [Kingdonia uniflora]|uniref:CCHC-type domain-containing protein n=1 Tax=Kingdonia uniflora TaxID=39325 RepID=A0A7J7M414_9MAGN|nr:hypothetical protein GIB67_003672 [Kingdonia uniflora]
MENLERNKSVAFKSSSYSSSSKSTIEVDNSSNFDNDDGSNLDSQIASISHRLKNLVKQCQFQKQEQSSNQEQNEFEDLNLEDLYAQTLAKCMKLGKLNKVLKNQVNTLKYELQDKIENTSHEIDVLKNEKLGLHDKVVFLEKEVNDAKEKIKSTLDELHSAKLDVVLTEQKLEKFCHGAKNIDKILCMGKTDSYKRGLGYDEPLPKSKTPQIANFVKATSSTLVLKHNMIYTTHNHSKRVSYSHIYYCSICGQKGHIASYCRFVRPYQPYGRPFNGYRYESYMNVSNVKRGQEDLMSKVDSTVEACDDTLSLGVTQTSIEQCQNHVEERSLESFKRRKLSESTLSLDNPCQELDNICCENNWILPICMSKMNEKEMKVLKIEACSHYNFLKTDFTLRIVLQSLSRCLSPKIQRPNRIDLKYSSRYAYRTICDFTLKKESNREEE